MKRSILYLFLVPAVLFSFSCANDEEKCAEEYANDVQDELNAFINAALAYSTDQSAANCTAYKNATQAYLDVLEDYVDCGAFTSAEQDQLQQDIDNAEADLATLPC